MSIVVSCTCGKRFKANDSLAGKKVRCPGCQACVRIPGGEGSGSSVAVSAQKSATKSKKASSAAVPSVNAEEALLKFEEVQRRKQLDAEAEAAYREEQNKLIQSYDQIAGKATVKKETEEEKKKRKGLAETGVKKVTIFTRIADVFATIFGTLIVRYIIFFALGSAGVVGSVYLVRYVAGYMNEETAAQAPVEQQIKDLFKQAQAAVMAGRCNEAERKLKEVLRLEPGKEMHNSYTSIKRTIEERRAKGTCVGLGPIQGCPRVLASVDSKNVATALS